MKKPSWNLRPLPAELRDTCLRYFDLRCATWQHRTITCRRYTVLRFIEFLSEYAPEVQNWSQLRRHPHVEDWIASLKDKAPVTRSNEIQIIEQFLTDVTDWEWPNSPPRRLFQETDLPRMPQRLPQPLDPEDDRRLTAYLQNEDSVMSLGLRFLRQTGLRGGELLSLPTDAVSQNREGQYILKVPLGKTLTERIFPLTAESRAIIEEILRKRGCKTNRSDLPPFLMLHEHGQPVPYHVFRRYLIRVARAAGLHNQIHLHQLRHTFATELARTGIPLPTLMALLGHRSPSMTMRYVLLTSSDVRNSYEQAILHLPALQTTGRVLTPQPQAQTASLEEEFDALITRLDYQRRDQLLGGKNADQLTRLINRLRTALHDFRNLP